MASRISSKTGYSSLTQKSKRIRVGWKNPFSNFLLPSPKVELLTKLLNDPVAVMPSPELASFCLETPSRD
jgi:hypothetical protein